MDRNRNRLSPFAVVDEKKKGMRKKSGEKRLVFYH